MTKWLKKGIAALLSGLLIANLFGEMPAMAKPASRKPTIRVTYQEPSKYIFQEPLNIVQTQYIQFAYDMVKATNPNPEEVVKQNYFTYQLADLYGESANFKPSLYYLDSGRSFLLSLYNQIGVFPPVYPEGYDPAEEDKKIASITDAGQLQEAKRRRVEIEINARLQAFIDRGYLLEGEAEGEITKRLAANVLYRMFKDVIPYQKRKAVANTDDIAVRWAVEVGLPGFQLDEKGRINPDEMLIHDELVGIRQFIYLFFPSKWTDRGWEYYQFELNNKPEFNYFYPSYLVYINNTPFYEYQQKHPEFNSSDKAFEQAMMNAVKQLFSAMHKNCLSLIEEFRVELKKPRLYSWKTDVIDDPRFKGYVTEYRKTKSEKTLQKAYQEIRKTYRLTKEKDSINVIRSVFKNVK